MSSSFVCAFMISWWSWYSSSSAGCCVACADNCGFVAKYPIHNFLQLRMFLRPTWWILAFQLILKRKYAGDVEKRKSQNSKKIYEVYFWRRKKKIYADDIERWKVKINRELMRCIFIFILKRKFADDVERRKRWEFVENCWDVFGKESLMMM